jgi:hypothetical protein
MSRNTETAGRAGKSHRHERRMEKITAYELGKPRAPRMRNPNTGIPEFVVWSLFDIYAVAAGGVFNKLALYTLQQGANYAFNGVTAFAKGEQHCSLVQPGQLESSYTFIVRAISIYVQGQQGTAHPGAHREDMENLLGSLVKFRINKKEYFIGIPAWLPGGGGQFTSGFGSLTAPTASFTNTNGWADTDNVYALPGGQYINPQETFDCIVDPSGNALAAGGNGSPTALAAAGNPVGVPAAGICAWFRQDGQLIRVAQ